MEELTIFDMIYPKYKITKPIRLIEMFSGYGSQALALKYLGVPFEHWKICEWAIKSIQAYKDIHFTDDDTDYSQGMNESELMEYLYHKGISNDYNKPMTLQQIGRIYKKGMRKVYNNIQATHNLVNIQQVKGKDLEIVDTDKYDYILTYSFPCQDLSLAGKGKGMSDTSTRSGMLWEVERILTECYELGTMPQILLMENVPQVHGVDNLQDFNKWQLRLEELGYKNYWQDLIATDYGIPQTRNRCFMVSILGDYSYTFPKPIPLNLKLKDMLEDNVDEKYYLSDKQIKDIQSWNAYEKPLETIDKDISKTLTTRIGAYCSGMQLVKDTENYIEWEDGKNIQMNCRAWKEDKIVATLNTGGETKILIKNATSKGYLEATDGDGIDISSRMEYHRGNVQKDKIQTLTTSGGNDRGVVINMKTKLCNDLIEQGKVKENDVIRHSYTTSKMNGDMKDLKQNNLSPTLDTRCDCLGVTVKIIGNYSPSNHNASRIVDQEYSAPTVMENHGTITATQTNDLRIRKLTPYECFALMGVKREDYLNCAKNQSDSSLYHLAGDSIVVNVLMAIFKELL